MKKIIFLSLFLTLFSQTYNALRAIDDRSMMTIDYQNKDLEYILMELAAYKGINVIIPQENQKLNAKVTMQLPKKVSIDEAWNLLLEMLTISGYSLKEGNESWTVIKNNNFSGEALQTYINQNPPESEIPVRYLYFFKNISITGTDTSNKSNIESILNDMLSQPAQNNYMFISSSNALMISDKASIVNGVMNIIKTIDNAGFKEAIAVVPLRFSKSSNVVKLLNQLIPSDQNQVGYSPILKKENSRQDKFFSEDTKITSIDYSNSIVLLGNRDAINQVKDFIYQYIDVPLETDRSIIHVVPLDYLNSNEFAPILQNLLTSSSSSQQGSQSTSSTSTIGLQNVIVVAEQSQNQQDTQGQNSNSPQYAGGNNLLIAARDSDMKTIRKIIKELDQPEPQVVLESVIVDLTQRQYKNLGFYDTRSPNNPNDPNLIKWQGNTQGQNGSPILNYIKGDQTFANCDGTINSARGLAADLLEPCVNSNGEVVNPVSFGKDAGTLLVSFNDQCGSVASILELLDKYSIRNVLSDPFVVTKNNHKASITSSETRIVRGATQAESTGGPVVINQEQIEANISVQVTPRIADDNTVNLEVSVEISEFPSDQSSGDNTIDRRKVVTSANLKSGEVLVIGGLSKSRLIDRIEESPFGNIPLVGWLFKRQNRRPDNKSLYIFISPSIVRKAGKIGIERKDIDKIIQANNITGEKVEYIRDMFCREEKNLYGNNFEALRDPITRIFFAPIEESPSERSGSYIPLR